MQEAESDGQHTFLQLLLRAVSHLPIPLPMMLKSSLEKGLARLLKSKWVTWAVTSGQNVSGRPHPSLNPHSPLIPPSTLRLTPTPSLSSGTQLWREALMPYCAASLAWLNPSSMDPTQLLERRAALVPRPLAKGSDLTS
jgi:hypothetical protein